MKEDATAGIKERSNTERLHQRGMLVVVVNVSLKG